MKQTFVLIAFVAIGILAFGIRPKKDEFKEIYQAYADQVENTRMVMESRGDTARALKLLEVAGARLRGYDTFMEQESANGWPGYPANCWCILEAVYQYYRCTHILGEGWDYCWGKYEWDVRKCKGE